MISRPHRKREAGPHPIILKTIVLRHKYKFDVLFSIVLRTNAPPQSAAGCYDPASSDQFIIFKIMLTS